MTYLISRFQKIVRKNKVFKRGTNGPQNATQGDTCYKCGKAGHFIKKCPLLKNENKEHQKPRSDKEKRRDLVLDKNDRKAAADYVVKKALAAWRDSSSDSEDPDEPNDVSMVRFMKIKPYSMKCLLSWLIQKMKKRMTRYLFSI